METFKLDDSQIKKLNEWFASKTTKYTGAIGGRFAYYFHPTTLGVVVKVVDEIDKSEIDLTDYKSW